MWKLHVEQHPTIWCYLFNQPIVTDLMCVSSSTLHQIYYTNHSVQFVDRVRADVIHLEKCNSMQQHRLLLLKPALETFPRKKCCQFEQCFYHIECGIEWNHLSASAQHVVRHIRCCVHKIYLFFGNNSFGMLKFFFEEHSINSSIQHAVKKKFLYSSTLSWKWVTVWCILST